MKKYIILTLFLSAICTSSLSAKENIELYFKGAPEANNYSEELPDVFNEWCDGVCVPTTQFEAVDPKTDAPQGFLYVWGKDFINSSDGMTICFTEFVLYDLPQGQIYTISDSEGTCGAFMDPSIVPPVSNSGAIVLAGGGDGDIVGGTRKFDGLLGSYNDRVFVEFLNGGINYYNSLFFHLIPSK